MRIRESEEKVRKVRKVRNDVKNLPAPIMTLRMANSHMRLVEPQVSYMNGW
jgi:hypothetical protein